MKFVLVVLVVVVVLWLMLGRRRGDGVARAKAKKTKPAPTQAMLECAHCGLHLPEADAVMAGSQVFCSEAHRALGARPPGPT